MNWKNDYHYSHVSPLSAGEAGLAQENGFAPYISAAFSAPITYEFTVGSENEYAQTRTVIQPQGTAVAGQVCLYLVEACAAEYADPLAVGYGASGDVPLPPAWLQIQGQTLAGTGQTNADGSVWGATVVTAPAGTTPEVTPTATQHYAYNYYSFTNQAFPLQLISQCVATTPSNQARTNLGVGEQVNLFFNPALPMTNVTWSATAGGLAVASGATNLFTAPSNAANVTVTAIIGSKPVNFYFKVIEPSTETSVISSNDIFTAGIQGVGMWLTVTMQPTNVSFYRVQILEAPSPATNITGYFTNFDSSLLAHHPNTNWVTLSQVNQSIDHASFFGFGQPWGAGEFDFDIPVQWRITDGVVTNNLPHRLQQHKITGSDGTSTIIKLESSTTRTP